VPIAPSNVRVWRRTGKHLLARRISHFDPKRTFGQSFTFIFKGALGPAGWWNRLYDALPEREGTLKRREFITLLGGAVVAVATRKGFVVCSVLFIRVRSDVQSKHA
jgi:hypothetical protein